jgi:hypothetical protein
VEWARSAPLKFSVFVSIENEDLLTLAAPIIKTLSGPAGGRVWLEESKLKAQNQPAIRSAPGSPRCDPRFQLVVDITVRSRTRGVLNGYTVDISESGISAMLRIDVPLAEIVELNFTLPIGQVKVHAIVRQRDCFRYGFQFLESAAVQEIIRSTCRQLAERTLSAKL